MGSSGKSSRYGYLLGFRGMCRAKLPDFDLQRSHTPTSETQIEAVFTCKPEKLPLYVGLFSSGHNVNMVGGLSNDPQNSIPLQNLYVFDPTKHEEENFPVKDPSFLDKPIDLPPDSKFQSIVHPIVIQPNNQHHVYFLTQYWSPWRGKLDFRRMCFQSFDPTKNTFHVLQSPPYRRESRTDHFREVGCFAAGDYIYLFIQDHLVSYIWHHDRCKYTRVFSFNTFSSEWKEIKDTVRTFKRNEIPIPFFHRGDAGMSKEFPDKTRIMVATCDSDAIAYRVHLGENGSLLPTSYRYLLDRSHITKDGSISQLHDIGSGRFLVFFQSKSIPFRLYVFQIDYDLEHKNQYPSKFPIFTESTELLWSTKILDAIPSFGYPRFHGYCLANAPTPQSSGNQIEEQGRKLEVHKRNEISSPKRKDEQLKGDKIAKKSRRPC